MILVAGAAGFVGRAVTAQLRREHMDHLGADRHDAEFLCDITDPSAIASLFRVDVVIHLAGLLATACRLNPAEATRVNIGGSANLLEAAARHGVRRFVFASSFSVYLPGHIYGAAKRFMELYGETLARRSGMQFAALRIATVVGPGARHTASPWRSEIFEKLGATVKQRIVLPFAADSMLSIVHVEDAARMLFLLATAPVLPAHIYDSPAENWSARELKEAVEGLNAHLTLELQPGEPPLPTPGGDFTRDFGFQPTSLAAHLRNL